MKFRAIVLCVIALLIGVSVQGPSANAQSDPARDMSLKSKVVLITGSTDGLGREVARVVGSLGARVIVHGRNKERGDAVVQEITKEGRGSAKFYAADFASLAEVRGFAETLLRDYPRIDVLVNNAGVWVRDGQRSGDGHELNLAVNYLAPFLLTRTLLPRLTASAPARIINVASVAQTPIDFTDLMLERPGRAAQGYGQSKLAMVMFTLDLAAELKDKGVTAVSVHPATMMDTTMVRQSGMPARTTVDEGKAAVMNLIQSTPIENGAYYNGQKPARANAQAYDDAARAKLRDVSMQLSEKK